MFSRVSAVLALAALATATTTVSCSPQPTSPPKPASQCNTGGLQCCNSVQKSFLPYQGSSSAVVKELGLLGVVLSDVNVLVGLACSPIDVVGTSGTCSANPVCCENNDFNGLINIGCVPVNINA
ncbi:fungal hydrophobin [Coniophora puteana RWD-64-598 SS2]|uniref:Hydrophobin n=1 Tax=Coniophora puteana (strain RWD-64-598) TaxID=741705 RepID=A0A5M3N3I2_CONPW|nr:fungal hydrophobin [Coniophora puteana RWD-64-598 SS2]EIW85896.1 fungal hydrophobin [Coniophora puteana RWD-64-598 SS2]